MEECVSLSRSFEETLMAVTVAKCRIFETHTVQYTEENGAIREFRRHSSCLGKFLSLVGAVLL